MKAKAISRVDGQGRIVIPANIRNTLSLKTGSVVTVSLDHQGMIRVEPMNERRCAICGESVEASNRVTVKIGPHEKDVCVNCAKVIGQAEKAVK